jgi:hypothetical protein
VSSCQHTRVPSLLLADSRGPLVISFFFPPARATDTETDSSAPPNRFPPRPNSTHACAWPGRLFPLGNLPLPPKKPSRIRPFFPNLSLRTTSFKTASSIPIRVGIGPPLPYIKRRTPLPGSPPQKTDATASSTSTVSPEPPNAVASTSRASPASKDSSGEFSAPPFLSLTLGGEL